MTEFSEELHYRSSVYREVMIEHLLIGELLRSLWRRGIADAEILRSEFDAGGYDLVVSRGPITRHVQLKSKIVSGATRDVKVSLNLAAKPSGCVVWLEMNDDMTFCNYLWFGGEPLHPLPSIEGYPTAKHTKGNSDGTKLDRPNLRVVPIRAFSRLASLDDLVAKMLGV